MLTRQALQQQNPHPFPFCIPSWRRISPRARHTGLSPENLKEFSGGLLTFSLQQQWCLTAPHLWASVRPIRSYQSQTKVLICFSQQLRCTLGRWIFSATLGMALSEVSLNPLESTGSIPELFAVETRSLFDVFLVTYLTCYMFLQEKLKPINLTKPTNIILHIDIKLFYTGSFFCYPWSLQFT